MDAGRGKTNKLVQTSVRMWLPARLLVNNCPKQVNLFYVDYYNSRNRNATEITVVQGREITGQIEAHFKLNNDANPWTAERLGGQGRANQIRLTTARTMFPFRWGGVEFDSYEVAASFYKWSSHHLVNKDLIGHPLSFQLTVWRIFEVHINNYIDLTHPCAAAARHPRIFENVNCVFKALKLEHQEWVGPVISLLSARASGKHWGQGEMCPEGLPNPPLTVITDEMLQMLVRDMSQSETVKLLMNPEVDTQRPQ
ncbi:hypothetical protein N9L19_00615 [bacterium]|nr:hypothetical protein [bacterium]